MRINNLIDRFNQPDVHLVVSAWPEKNNTHGIAWYTKLITTELARRSDMRFVVLAEKGTDNIAHVYGRGRILVLRVFDNRHPSLYPTILTWLTRFSTVRTVSVHSEFGVNAGLKHYMLLLPFLALIKLTGKRVIYYAHNVVTDVGFLLSHLNIYPHPVVVDLANLAVRIHSKLLSKLADKIVVLDEALKKRFEKIIGSTKKIVTSTIPVIPIANIATKSSAKKTLNILHNHKVLLAFGFISSYKGTDWLVHAFDAFTHKYPDEKIHLVIAGGPAHSLKERPYYQTFYDRIFRKAQNNSHITMTGFIPEHDIKRYFAAADLIILPYRGLMGASGALTHALSHGKPVMLSDSMREITYNQDVQSALKQSNGDSEDLFFPMNQSGISQIVRTIKSVKKLEKLHNVSVCLAQERGIEEVADQAYNEIYTTQYTHETVPFFNRLALSISKNLAY